MTKIEIKNMSFLMGKDQVEVTDSSLPLWLCREVQAHLEQLGVSCEITIIPTVKE